MRIEIEATDIFTPVGGVVGRLWSGETAGGTPIAVITTWIGHLARAGERVTASSTSEFSERRGLRARVWRGVTRKGAPFNLHIVGIATILANHDSELERELEEIGAPDVDLSVIAGVLQPSEDAHG